MTGVHQRRSDGHGGHYEMQPVDTIKGWAGDTGYGVLRKMIIEKDKSDVRKVSGEGEIKVQGEDDGERDT